MLRGLSTPAKRVTRRWLSLSARFSKNSVGGSTIGLQIRPFSDMIDDPFDMDDIFNEEDDRFTAVANGFYDPFMWEDYFDYLKNLEAYHKSYKKVEDDVKSRTVDFLRLALDDRKLKKTGKKNELIERILATYKVLGVVSNHAGGPAQPTENDNKDASKVINGEVNGSTDAINGSKNSVIDGSKDAINGSKSRNESERSDGIIVTENTEYCFDAAHECRLVPKEQLEQEGRLQDALPATLSSEDPSHEAQSLLDLLPTSMTSGFPQELVPTLMEIVLDVGKRPFAWVEGKRHFLCDDIVTHEQLQEIVKPLHFGPDNRAGINGSLHRISAIRNRDGVPIGLTMRVGRYVPGNATMISDVLTGMSNASVLIVGDPGSGKTSIVRDVARFLSEKQSLLIIDTSCEIGGSGDVPHPCIGLSRRMQVKNIESQANVMIECVQNHTPAVMVIDEIGREAEVRAALTCKERGVRMIASAHGNLSGLVRNATLCDLIGGVDVVTVGDKTAVQEAKRHGSQQDGVASKLKAQRRGPPIFDVIIEVKRGILHEWHVVLHSASAVDSILSDGRYVAQSRIRESSGASIIKTKHVIKLANNVEEIMDTVRPQSILNAIPTSAKNRKSTDDLVENGSQNHVSHDEQEKPDPFTKTCGFCEKTFTSRKGYLSHALNKTTCRSKLSVSHREFLRKEARSMYGMRC